MFTVFKKKLEKIVRLSSKVSQPEKYESVFYDDPVLGVKRRHYETYEEYLHHQAEKLSKVGDDIVQSDQEYERLVIERYQALFDFRGKTVLCLGARLGGEVRAFKALGALSVGIDIEPGSNNCHVLHGDFHDILFPDNCFDFVFTNVIDHVLELDRFISEAARVLKAKGSFLIELAQVKPGKYEVLDTSNPELILKPFYQKFELVVQQPVVNRTQYIDWKGQFLHFRKMNID